MVVHLHIAAALSVTGVSTFSASTSSNRVNYNGDANEMIKQLSKDGLPQDEGKEAETKMQQLTAEEFKQSSKIPIVLVLDNARSLNNVGSAFRTVDAFLLESIYLCGITGTPPHRDIQKTTLGATETVEWKYFKITSDAILDFKKNVMICAVEQVEDATPLPQLYSPENKKIAFVFGSEITDVDEKNFSQFDSFVEIPQLGSKHSLNILVSIGIVVWDIFVKVLKK